MSQGGLRGIGELSRERFVELYLELGDREGLLLEPVLDEERFVILDRGRMHELTEVYERFLALPDRSRRDFLLRVLRGGELTAEVEVPPYAAVRGHLLPRLRSGAYLDLAQLDDRRRGRPGRNLHAPLVGELYVSVVIDGEESMTAVTRPMLERWQVPFEDLLREARDNLRRVDDTPMGELSPGFWMGPWDDSYAASRLLMPEIFPKCGEPVVAVPNRDTLLVADGRNDTAVSALVSLIESVTDGGPPLSHQIFRLSGDELEPWTLPGTHESAVLHRRLCVSERVRRYGKQQWPLQEAEGDAWYVASAELDHTRDGSVVTRALWTEGVQALLPEVDRLHLLSTMEDGTSSRLLVADFADICDLDGVVERTPNLLPRWRTLRFPTPSELSAIAVPVALDPGTASLSDPGGRS